jgi:hypothetical protein
MGRGGSSFSPARTEALLCVLLQNNDVTLPVLTSTVAAWLADVRTAVRIFSIAWECGWVLGAAPQAHLSSRFFPIPSSRRLATAPLSCSPFLSGASCALKTQPASPS